MTNRVAYAKSEYVDDRTVLGPVCFDYGKSWLQKHNWRHKNHRSLNHLTLIHNVKMLFVTL